jgi:hypothetical protein
MTSLKFDVVLSGLDLQDFSQSSQQLFIRTFDAVYKDLVGSSGFVRIDAIFPGSVVVRVSASVIATHFSGDSAFCVFSDRAADGSLAKALRAADALVFTGVTVGIRVYTSTCTSCRCVRGEPESDSSGGDDVNVAAIVVPIVVIALVLLVLLFVFVYLRRERSRRFV